MTEHQIVSKLAEKNFKNKFMTEYQIVPTSRFRFQAPETAMRQYYSISKCDESISRSSNATGWLCSLNKLYFARAPNPTILFWSLYKYKCVEPIALQMRRCFDRSTNAMMLWSPLYRGYACAATLATSHSRQRSLYCGYRSVATMLDEDVLPRKQRVPRQNKNDWCDR